MMMRSRIVRKIKIVMSLTLLVIFTGYVYIQTNAFLKGPEIAILSPTNGSVVEEGVANLEGQAKNISWISVNGRSIFVDEDGFFSEKEVLQEGYNVMVVEAGDKFGNKDREVLQIIYQNKLATNKSL
jgi:hypothetical protein